MRSCRRFGRHTVSNLLLKGYASQFGKVTTNYDYQSLSYDILSIMHYGNYAFSRNGLPTIVAKSDITLYESYAKSALSNLDVAEIIAAYNDKF